MAKGKTRKRISLTNFARFNNLKIGKDMVIKLSPKIKKEVSVTVKDYGYKGEKEFIEDALWHRILELKKVEFLAKVREVRGKMRKKGFTEKEILKDFNKFLHRK